MKKERVEEIVENGGGRSAENSVRENGRESVSACDSMFPIKRRSSK